MAACASQPSAPPAAPPPVDPTPPVARAEPAPDPVPPTPVPKTKPPAPPTPEQRQALGVDDDRPLTAGRFIGLEFEEVRRLLGDPTLRLDEPPARIWQYQSAECTLRLTFLPEVNSQRYRSLSVMLANSEEDTEDAKSRCLSAIRAGARRS